MKFRFDTPFEQELEIVREKHQQLIGIMKETSINCWLVFVRETEMNPDPVFPLIIGGDVVWESAFIFNRIGDTIEKIAIIGNFDADAEERKGFWDKIVPYTEGISSVLQKTIQDLNPNSIALNYSDDDVSADGLSHGMFRKISSILPSFSDKFVSASPIIQRLRARKTPTEVEMIRQACIMTEEINQEIQQLMKPGMTEIEIQKLFHQAMDSRGVIEAWQRDACPAVDAGPDKVMGHVGPTDLKAMENHSLHNDFGIQLDGYCSDIQRMWFFGKKEDIPDELQHAFNTVYTAIAKAAEFIKPGVKGYEVDKVARDHVVSQGYEEYKHALGHQVGRKAHDGGALLGPLWERYGDTPKGLIDEGNVFTLELYVKTENYGMVSLEEDILVTANGCEFLVPRQEEWICLS